MCIRTAIATAYIIANAFAAYMATMSVMGMRRGRA